MKFALSVSRASSSPWPRSPWHGASPWAMAGWKAETIMKRDPTVQLPEQEEEVS